MDALGIRVKRMIARALLGEEWGSFAIVTGYDPATHTATVRLEPAGKQTGALPIIAPGGGWRDALYPGTQVYVACQRGVPVGIMGVVPTAQTVLPGRGMALSVNGQAVIFADLTVKGPVHLGQAVGLPTATAALRGALLVLATEADGASGTADALYVCLQQADGSLAWKAVTVT